MYLYKKAKTTSENYWKLKFEQVRQTINYIVGCSNSKSFYNLQVSTN